MIRDIADNAACRGQDKCVSCIMRVVRSSRQVLVLVLIITTIVIVVLIVVGVVIIVLIVIVVALIVVRKRMTYLDAFACFNNVCAKSASTSNT